MNWMLLIDRSEQSTDVTVANRLLGCLLIGITDGELVQLPCS